MTLGVEIAVLRFRHWLLAYLQRQSLRRSSCYHCVLSLPPSSGEEPTVMKLFTNRTTLGFEEAQDTEATQVGSRVAGRLIDSYGC